MSDKEKMLLVKLLGISAEEFANHGCNDLPDDFWEGWTTMERQAFCKEFEDFNGSPQDYDPNHLHLPDFAVMGFLADKLRKEVQGDQ